MSLKQNVVPGKFIEYNFFAFHLLRPAIKPLGVYGISQGAICRCLDTL